MKFKDRLDTPVGRMVVAAVTMMLLFMMVLMLRMADYETFGLMCESFVFVWLLMFVYDIVSIFFSAYRDYKKEKVHE